MTIRTTNIKLNALAASVSTRLQVCCHPEVALPGMGEDFLRTSLLGWEYVTGGFFTMAIIGIFMLMTYIKYHKAVYPLMIGLMFLPVSQYLFPIEFIIFGAIWTIALVGILLWYVYTRQTKEF